MDGRLHLKRRDALEVSAQVRALRRMMDTHLPRVRIEDLLRAVDTGCDFTRALRPLVGATPATRLALIWLARWCDWCQPWVVMQPATLIRWHRQGFRLLWRWKSRHGRPPIPAALQALIRHMARENPTWGQERISNIGATVSHELLAELDKLTGRTP